MSNIALFASGSGSNAENIASFFSGDPNVSICCILCNNPNAFVIERAKSLGIPYHVFTREELYSSTAVLDLMTQYEIDFIILAGFLWKIPHNLIECFPHRIINLHPALLPKFGGKGMYGAHVHQAVIEAGEKESGITIHYVDEHYDEGATIFQAKCAVETNETVETLSEKIHKLEHFHYPRVIQSVITSQKLKKE